MGAAFGRLAVRAFSIFRSGLMVLDRIGGGIVSILKSSVSLSCAGSRSDYCVTLVLFHSLEGSVVGLSASNVVARCAMRDLELCGVY